MPHPDEEILAAIALGDLDDVGAADREHVDSCPACRGEVEELRTVLAVARDTAGDRLESPPASVWDRIAADVGASGPPRPAGAATTAAPAPTPARAPTSPPAAAPALAPPPRPTRRRVPVWAVAVAASVALVAGLLGGWAAGHGGQDRPAPAVVAHAELHTLTGNVDRGTADVVRRDGHLVLWVSGSAIGDTPGLHEVWLINTDGKRMVSVGLLSPTGGRFDVPQRLIDEGYRIVDVSAEPDDGNPAHSGDSIARGELSF